MSNWNKERRFISWDPRTGQQGVAVCSDREALSDPFYIKNGDVLNAICRVLSELIEIEESRK